MEKITEQTEVSVKELAMILGLSVRRVHQLRENGLITKTGRGCFNLVDAVHAYIEHSAAIAAEKKAAATDETVTEKRTADIELKKKRATKTDVDAESKRLDNELKRLRLQEMRNQLCPYKAFEFIFSEHCIAVKQRMLAMPGRLAVDVHAAQSPSECAEIIKKQVHEALNELSEYKFDEKRVTEILDRYDMSVTY